MFLLVNPFLRCPSNSLTFSPSHPEYLSHPSEVILTLGHSKTVEAFLKQAYRDRKFTVIVLESAPSYLGHSMASALSSANIPVLLVPDSALCAIMPRVTKVIIGSHAVLANGGLFALSGTLPAALAARSHCKPVVVTTGQFKFAPVWNLYHEYAAVDFRAPGEVAGTQGNGGGGGVEGVQVSDPYYDYIRPELVNLFVTNEWVSFFLPFLFSDVEGRADEQG